METNLHQNFEGFISNFNTFEINDFFLTGNGCLSRDVVIGAGGAVFVRG